MRTIIIAIKMEFVLASCVRGHHVYKDIWSPNFGEELTCRREEGNVKDSYAVAVFKISSIVGHLPRNISAACSLFLNRGGSYYKL